jgi:hypothetical protein
MKHQIPNTNNQIMTNVPKNNASLPPLRVRGGEGELLEIGI